MPWRLWLIVGLIFLHGCAQPPHPEPVAAEPAPPAPKPAMQVAVLVSEDIPAYSDVARALARQLGKRGTVRTLGSSQAENLHLAGAYANDDRRQIVSIGLNAAVASRPLVNRQVVFCQVFNYQDYDLLSERHKGVSMMPAPTRIFSSWHALSPKLTDVGVISGPGFSDLLQTARAAARVHGINLHHVVVNSDKEYQYAYKRLADKVQGYWLLPDNRVLSGLVLRDVMTFSVRNSKQVVVFNEELLNLGGLLSVSSDPQDIAQEVLQRLEQGQNKDSLPGADIVYPDRPNLRINAVMAQRLDLTIPVTLRKYANTPRE